MRTWIILATLSAQSVLGAPAGAPTPRSAPLAGEAEGLFPYALEKSDLNFADLLKLRSGAQRFGKVMEWADQVLLFDGRGERTAYRLDDVEEYRSRRWERHLSPPSTPDLTVAYVERLPRDPHWHGHVVFKDGVPQLDIDAKKVAWRPTAGTEVKFRVHVHNAGGARSAAATVRVSIDDAELARVPLGAVDAGAEQTVEASWHWKDGPHTLRVELDPDKKTEEYLRWNNTFVEPVQALGVVVAVARQRYEAFSKVPNLTDSFCFEDWLQYQLRCLNALMAVSTYPSAPKGIAERVRLDGLIVVDDPFGAAGRATIAERTHRGGKPDGLAEFASLVMIGPPAENESVISTSLAVDWSMLKAIGRDLGLVDLTAVDTRPEQCLVRDLAEYYVERAHVFPWPRTLMHTPGGFPLSEPCAGYLNATQGKPRGMGGTYLWQVPERVVLETVSNTGQPLANVNVDVFQLSSEGPRAGMISGASGTEPLISGKTDEHGRLELPNRPAPDVTAPNGYSSRANVFGKVACDGSNGLLMLRLRSGKSEEFHFLRLFDCNVAYLRGQKQEYVHRLSTRMAGLSAPPAPAYAAVRLRDLSDPGRPKLTVGWRPPGGIDLNRIGEFRLYKRPSLADEESHPWNALAVVERAATGFNLDVPIEYEGVAADDDRLWPDVSYAVTTVDKLGRESALSPGTAYLGRGRDSVKFAVSPQSPFEAYTTIQGVGASRLLHFNNDVGVQPYGVRTLDFTGYEPAFAGVAVASDGRVVVTDPVNHVLAFYEKGDLKEVVPRPPQWPGRAGAEKGAFNMPADVAIDNTGRLFVADRGNDRVQILSADGRYEDLLDPDFGFIEPFAVGYATGHVCVTDDGGKRCRVYDVSKAAGPVFVCQLPALVEADRALVSNSGKVHVAAKDDDGTWAVLVFKPDGKSAKIEKRLTDGLLQGGKIDRPRGLYYAPAGTKEYAYFVNQFPFSVRRVIME